MLKIATVDNPLCFDTPPRGTPANIRIYLIYPETRVISLRYEKNPQDVRWAGC